MTKKIRKENKMAIKLPEKPVKGKIGHIRAAIRGIKDNIKAGKIDKENTIKFQKELEKKKEELANALQEANKLSGTRPPSSLGSKVKTGAGVTAAGGAGKVAYDVATKEFPDAPTYKKGGIVKKRANKSKTNSKSVAKKYFKGTF